MRIFSIPNETVRMLLAAQEAGRCCW